MLKRLLLAGLLGALIAMPATAAELTLKASHDANPDEPYHLGLVRMNQLLQQKTGGKAEIKIFPNAQLGEEEESIEGTLVGTIDIAVTSNAKLVNFVPEMKIFSMPFMFNGPAHMDRALRDDEIVGKINQALGKKGFRLLGLFSAGTRHIMNSERPIFSIKDLEGLKIRTMGNPAHVDAFNQFGANATPLAYDELYGALQTGVVDGAEAANTNYFSKKFYEVAPYWAQVGWLEIMAPVIMGEQRFQKLQGDLRSALLAAGVEAAEHERQVYAESDKEKLGMLLDQGVRVTVLDSKPFRKRAQAVYDKYLTTDFDQELLRMIKAKAER